MVFYGWNEVDRFIDAWRNARFRIIGHFVFYEKYASNSGMDKKHMAYRHECAYLLAKVSATLRSFARCHGLELCR